jgi:phage nucleotide-binding protein
MKQTTGQGISVMVYGDGGVGKTSLLRSLPPDKTLVIDVEDRLGILAARGWEGKVVKLSRNADGQPQGVDDQTVNLRELLAWLALAQHPYQFIAIDSISQLERWMIATLTAYRGKLYTEMKEHGDIAGVMRARLLALLDLRRRGINIVIVSHESSDARGMKGIAVPSINTKVGKDLIGWCDQVGRMSTPLDGKRTIQWDKSAIVCAKNSFDCVQSTEVVEKEDVTYLINLFRRIYHERQAAFNPPGPPVANPLPQRPIEIDANPSTITKPADSVAANAPAVGAPTTEAIKSEISKKKESK